MSRAAGVDKEPVKGDNVIRIGKGKYLFALRASGSVYKKRFLKSNSDGAVLRRKLYIKCNARREIFRGNVLHNYDEGTEGRLNRQALNNAVKMKAMEELCVTDSQTCNDKQNVGRNTHRARPSQLLPLPANEDNARVLTGQKDNLMFL